MRSLFTALLDLMFPPSPHARLVREATERAVLPAYAPRRFGATLTLAPYREPLMEALIQEAKFHRNERAIALLGQLLALHLHKTQKETRGAPERAHETYLIPIPLSRERLRERGYNQTLEIARAALASAARAHLADSLLRRIRHSAPQTSLSRDERLRNLAGAFAVNTDALPFQSSFPPQSRLILLDDVVTTGATLSEAARTLRNAGFTRVEQLTLAH